MLSPIRGRIIALCYFPTFENSTIASPPFPQLHEVTPDTLTQNAHAALLPTASPLDTFIIVQKYPHIPLASLFSPSPTKPYFSDRRRCRHPSHHDLGDGCSIGQILLESPPPPCQPTILAYFNAVTRLAKLLKLATVSSFFRCMVGYSKET